MPPPDTSLRPRKGYRPLDTEEDGQPEPATPIPEDEAIDVVDSREPEVAEQEGWAALIWSFTASGLMTVSFAGHRHGMTESNQEISSSHISFPSSLPFLYLEIIWRKIGFGLLHPVCHIWDKVRDEFAASHVHLTDEDVPYQA